MCSTAEHCQSEMLKKLRDWEIPEEDQASIMQFLVSERYVDDARYARAYAREKHLYAGWGPRKIEQGLKLKRIGANDIDDALAEVSFDDFVESLRRIIASKRRSVKASSDYERNGKLIRFAMSRGFTYDQIKCCLDVSDDF